MRGFSQWVGYALLSAAASFAANAAAERNACWQTQASQILAHSAQQTTGVFELSGRALETGADELRFQCNGTFLLNGADKQYNYSCDVVDPAGDKFSLQNSDSSLGATQYVSGGGTGKFEHLSGAALQYAQFPVNRDGSLPSCDAAQSAFRLP